MSHINERIETMKKSILIGVESFEEIIEGNYFYIDKTLFIKELLENKGKVTLITRPRRFGKTMNMSMLKHFFDISIDSRALFDGLKIMEHQDLIEKHLNKYPVIFLTLKNVELKTYNESIERIKFLMAHLFRRNLYLCEGDRLNEFIKKKFYRYCSEEATEQELQLALIFLAECLYTFHQKRVIILIDEYDAPINNALIQGYYEEMIGFMRSFLGSVFKTNDYLEFGVLTGVQRISKESLISEFNNSKVCGIVDDEFSTCYGFTEEEVKSACEQYGYGDRFAEVKKWYDGYRFGDNRDMYNPWSIVQFLCRGKFKDYWVNTGSLTILQDIFFKGSVSLKNDIAGLLTNTPIKMNYVEHITYPILFENDDIFWSMLLNTGYIKPCAGSTEDSFYAELVNREVKNIFTNCIDLWFKRQQNATPKIIRQFVSNLLKGDAEGVNITLNNELLNNPSCYDFKEENSYHMFIFGILLAVSGDYVVYSNPESGKGRSDCLIKPIDKEKYAVVIEFKHQSKDEKDLKLEAQKGLKQIEEKAYIHTLKQEGYKRLFKYGIAFRKKNCAVAIEESASSAL